MAGLFSRPEHPHAQPATLTLLGRSLPVDTARHVSTAGGGTAFLATLLLAGALARAPRQNPHERAHARHRRLLLPAEDIYPAPGRTVVDVANLEALAGLAQHHQSMILHRRHRDTDLYLHEHDNVIYRLESTPSGHDAKGDARDDESPTRVNLLRGATERT